MSKRKIIALFESGIPLTTVKKTVENKKLIESITKDELLNANSITLEGKCMDFKEMSENDRFYNREEFLFEFNRLAKVAENGQLFGSADHPEDDEEFIVKSGRIACIIDKLWYEEADDSCYIRLRLIPTINGGGKDLMVVVANGGVLCVSLRALGYVDEETKEAFVDTMYTFDVVAMPGIKSAVQRIVDAETGQILKEAKLVKMFENNTQQNSPDEISQMEIGDFIKVNLDTNTEVDMVLLKKPWKNSGKWIAEAKMDMGDSYEIAFNEVSSTWELDEDDHVGLLTEAINNRKSRKMANSQNAKVSSLRKVTGGGFANAGRFKKLYESAELDASATELEETDEEDLTLVQEAVENNGDENFAVLAENEDSALIQDKETGDMFVAQLKEAKNKRFSKVLKLKESTYKAIQKTQKLMESQEGIPAEMVTEAEEELAGKIQEAIEGEDENFQVLAETENGDVLVQDTETNDVYLASPEGSEVVTETEEEAEEDVPATLLESAKRKARLKEAMRGKKVFAVRKLKENSTVAKLKKMFESEDAKAVLNNTEEVVMTEAEMEEFSNIIENSADVQYVAESEDSILIENTEAGDSYIVGITEEEAEEEQPATPLKESKRKKVVSIKKLKEGRKSGLAKRLFESEGQEAVEDSMEEVEYDGEDAQLVEDVLNGKSDDLQVVAESDTAAMVEDSEGDVYMVETEEEAVSPLVESVRRKNKLKEALRGKKVIGILRFKESQSEKDIKEMYENEDVEAVQAATEEVPVTAEDQQMIKQDLQENGDLEIIVEDEDSVVVKDVNTDETLIVGTESLTESVKRVKSIMKFKESSSRIFKKAMRLKESENPEAVEAVVEAVDVDEEDLQLVEEVLNREEDHNIDVIEENDETAIITDKDSGESFLVETETEEVPVEELTPEEKNVVLEQKVEELTNKLNEVVEETNRISEYCEESSNAVNLMESSTKHKVFAILKETRRVDIFEQKRKRILESSPAMKMYESDDEVLMAYDGLDDEAKEQIVEALPMLTRDELLTEMRNH